MPNSVKPTFDNSCGELSVMRIEYGKGESGRSKAKEYGEGEYGERGEVGVFFRRWREREIRLGRVSGRFKD